MPSQAAWRLTNKPVSTLTTPTVGPPERVSDLSGQGVGPGRSGCRFAAAYAIDLCQQLLSISEDSTNVTQDCVAWANLYFSVQL